MKPNISSNTFPNVVQAIFTNSQNSQIVADNINSLE